VSLAALQRIHATSFANN